MVPPWVAGFNILQSTICSELQVQKYQKLTENGHFDRLESELEWSFRQPYLEEKGYVLRPRYIPNWKPSWIGTNRNPHFCEDSIRSRRDHVLDAVRSQDGAVVSIKVVRRDTQEIDIARLLSTTKLLDDPRNHCVPVLDVISDPVEPLKSLLVMPYLRPFDHPAFGAVGEVVDFIRQTLEGLLFMHDLGVAHRDCAAANIMMDARLLFPSGHHPVRRECAPDGLHTASFLSRTQCPVRYYFIDFGISTHFSPNQSPYVVGTKGRDKEAPELSKDVPYNAFALDTFILGHVYFNAFIARYDDLDFLESLVSEMLNPDPDCRPSARMALSMFEHICEDLRQSLLRWRLRSKEESISQRIFYDTLTATKEGLHFIKSLAGGTT